MRFSVQPYKRILSYDTYIYMYDTFMCMYHTYAKIHKYIFVDAIHLYVYTIKM